MLAAQERELEAAWFIIRIRCRIVCVYGWYTNGVIGNPLVTAQGQRLLSSAHVSTTNFLLVGAEGVYCCQCSCVYYIVCGIHVLICR